jgi:hemolysin D
VPHSSCALHNKINAVGAAFPGDSMTSSPHRLLAATLIFFFMAFVLWALFGTLDIVVTAQGKLVPKSFVQVSQPVEGGIIKEVLVKDGQRVKEGDVLLKLDALNASADRTALFSDQKRLKDTLLRIDAELGDKPAPEGVALEVRADYASRRAAYEASKTEAQLQTVRTAAEHSAAQAELGRLQSLAQFATQLETRNKGLLEQNYISAAAYDEKQRDALDAVSKVSSQKKTLLALNAANAQAQAALVRVGTEYRKALVVERAQVQAELSKVGGEAEKAAHREALTELRAPVTGYVNGLAIKTTGQVVQPGAVLLSVVPENEQLIAEVWVRNEDAGFVSPGMAVKVKLATYPFQKYGWIEGEVLWIGADSETPDTMKNSSGELLFYRARIALSRLQLERDGKVYPARPGMQVVADIKLGERTLMEYLTSPLKKTVLEAAREK